MNSVKDNLKAHAKLKRYRAKVKRELRKLVKELLLPGCEPVLMSCLEGAAADVRREYEAEQLERRRKYGIQPEW